MRTDEIDVRAGRSCTPGPRPPAGPTAWGLGKVQPRHHQRLAPPLPDLCQVGMGMQITLIHVDKPKSSPGRCPLVSWS